MTDLVAQTLYVDGVVGKATNLALLYDVLPPMPAVGDIVIYNGSAFSSLGGWDMGVPLPSSVTALRSVAVDPTTGELLATGDAGAEVRVFRYSSSTWDSGLRIPQPGPLGRGLTVRPNGNLLTIRGRRLLSI